MASLSEKKKKLALETYSTGNQENTTENQGITTTDDVLSSALKNQNYKDFYNRATQIYNMQSNAQKYLGNQLAQQGLQSQGYGSTAQSGLTNLAYNLYSQAQKDYSDKNLEIEQDALERQNQAQTEKDNQLVTFIQNAINNGQTDLIDTYLKNYGYMDETGAYTDAWNNLDADRKAYIESVIAGKQGVGNEYGDANIFNTSDFGGQVVYTLPNGQTTNASINDKFKYETQTVINNIANGNLQNGDLIKMTNISDGGTVYLVYDNGQLYYVKESYYNNAKGNKYTVTGKENTLKKA